MLQKLSFVAAIVLCALLFSLPAVAQETSETMAEEIQTTAANPTSGTMILHVTGVKKIKGELRCRLYNSEETFPSKDEKKMFRQLVVAVTAETTEVTVEDLPFGNYGVVVHHDWDADGKVDKTWYRAPKEPVACSNGAKGNFGPPNWEDAVFEFSQDSFDVPIRFE